MRMSIRPDVADASTIKLAGSGTAELLLLDCTLTAPSRAGTTQPIDGKPGIAMMDGADAASVTGIMVGDGPAAIGIGSASAAGGITAGIWPTSIGIPAT